MYRRQLASSLILILLCLALLGTGFFGLYYQYHLNELKNSIQQDIRIISDYATAVLRSKSDIYNGSFQTYLSSVAELSDSAILLCTPEGDIIFSGGRDLLSMDENTPTTVPAWAVRAALSGQSMPGLTTFDRIFSHSSYVSGVPIVAQAVDLQGNPLIDIEAETIGLIFIATDASYVRNFLFSALQLFFLVAAAVLLLALVVSSITTQHTVQPLREMRAVAYRFAHGDLDSRVEDLSSRNDEIGDLGVAFNAMADSLAQAEGRRSDFVANVSHELKTPMTTIAGFADGMLDGTIPPEQHQASLEIISSETRRLSRLVRRMLELSRLQSAERVAAQMQFDAGELLLRVLLSLEAQVNAKSLEVVTDLPEEAAMVWGEPDAITQVCYNLLDNAIKFSKQGGTLTLGIRFQGGKAYVSIQNQGETIPSTQLAEIFERFHKADSSRTSKDGVGLGLYIVKTILNTYHEQITVTSENGDTTFTFTLSEV